MMLTTRIDSDFIGFIKVELVDPIQSIQGSKDDILQNFLIIDKVANKYH